MRQVMNGVGGQTHCITAKFITTRRQAQILDLIFIIFFFSSNETCSILRQLVRHKLEP